MNTYPSKQGSIPTGLTDVVAIAAGFDHNLVLKRDGTLVAWGWNLEGETNIPTGLRSVSAIAVGGYHNLVLTPPVIGSYLYPQV